MFKFLTVLVRAWLAHCLRVRTDSVARYRELRTRWTKGIEDGIDNNEGWNVMLAFHFEFAIQ